MAELRAYHQPPECVHIALAGILCVLGRRRKQLEQWHEGVWPNLKDSLLDEMEALDAAAKGKKRPWSESKMVTKDLTSDEVRTHTFSCLWAIKLNRSLWHMAVDKAGLQASAGHVQMAGGCEACA